MTYSELERCQAERPEDRGLARALQFDGQQRAHETEKRDDAGENSQDFGNLESPVEDLHGAFANRVVRAKTNARSPADEGLYCRTSRTAIRRGVKVHTNSSDPRIVPLTTIEIEWHQDRAAVGDVIAINSENKKRLVAFGGG